MDTEAPKINEGGLLAVGIMQAMQKGFTVLYFLFLPILFAEQKISAAQLGYIGTFLIIGIMLAAILLSYKPDQFKKVTLLQISQILLFAATLVLFLPENIFVLGFAYFLIGVATGVGKTITNELAAQFTAKGKRYKTFANMAMLMDILRIVYPVIVGTIYVGFGFSGLIFFALSTVLATEVIIYWLTHKYNLRAEAPQPALNKRKPLELLRENKPFAFVMLIEFLDSFSSSQLFVFLPTLLIFKDFSIEFALGLQSLVFLGYLSGRRFVGMLADKHGGFRAVGIAEVGMLTTIVLLLILPPSLLLYVLCFLLGVFTRGTSQVIKAMAFDELESEDNRQGAAVHILCGDTGSALGQLIFGLVLAWFGVYAPFIGAILGAGVVALACFRYSSSKKSTV